MTNSQSVEQDGIIAGNIFAMLDNANKWEMVSELVCTTHKNAHDLARGQLEMGRKAKATSGCLINVVRFYPRSSVSSTLFRATDYC